MMTNSKLEMGERFKNHMWVKVCGWFSVIALTFLNMKGLPDAIAGFYGANITAAQTQTANLIAYVLIVAVLALLIDLACRKHTASKATYLRRKFSKKTT